MLKMTSFCLRAAKYKSTVRAITTLNTLYNKNEPPLSNSIKDFTPVYKFPYIRVISLVNRLKLYHTALTALAMPGSLMLWEFEVLHPETVLVTFAIGLTGCVSLFTVGVLANKFIGFIYLNKEENRAMVAYVDFWGRRQNLEVPLDDIVPFSEVPSSFTDKLYWKFSRFSVKDTLKINLKYGEVLDNGKFNKVFAS